MSGTNYTPPLPSPLAPQASNQTPYGQQYAAARPSPSPAPTTLQNPYSSYSSLGASSHSTVPQSPLYQPQHTYNQYTATTPISQQANPLANYYQSSHMTPRPTSQPSTSHSIPPNRYDPPVPRRDQEVYTLAEMANASIPADIRAQFQTDQHGKVIFFTTPPLDINPLPEEAQTLGHSLRYLADKARHKEEDEKKRKAREIELEAAANKRLKRMKTDEEGKKNWIIDQKLVSLQQWTTNMERGTDELYKQMHGENWKEIRELDLARLAVQQEEAFKNQKELEKFRHENKENKEAKITGFKWI